MTTNDVPEFHSRLVFDGIAYIDTDIIPEALASYRVRLGGETLKAAQRLFVVRAANATQIGAILGDATTTTDRRFSIYYGASSPVATGRMLSWNHTNYGFFLTPKRYGWGDSVVTFTRGSNAPSEPLRIGQNYALSGQPYTGKMDEFCIYGSDAQEVTTYAGFSSYTPAYTLRPCIYHGEAGFWCVETGKFYGNSAGAGVLSVED